MMGLETEMAISTTGPRRLNTAQAIDSFFREATEKLTHLPCIHGGGIWLANGARFYIDAGNHPEFCTPETNHPADVVRHVLAGDAIMEQVAQQVTTKHGLDRRWILFKCNVDYSGTLSTWACHESYSHRISPAMLPSELIPHFVSRIIYTGAGGFNPFKAGIAFCLSPRVYHLHLPVSESSTGVRAIYHVKNETLAGPGWNRLHVLCGDSVCSHRAAYLKMGATALVVTLAEAKLKPGARVALADPIAAMRTFNEDPLCQAAAPLMDGREVRALDIQRHYLEMAEQNLGKAFMPPWAAEVCRVWRDTLDRLEAGPSAVQSTLDWAIKRSLYHHFAEKRGFDPGEFASLNQRVGRTSEPLPGPDPDSAEGIFAHVLTRDRLRSQRLQALVMERRPDQRILDATEKKYLELRDELCELDMRFSQIGEDGIFAGMDKAGQLDHAVDGITTETINDATVNPPSSGRARVRGEYIRRFADDPGHACDWQELHDPDGRVIFLNDPFADTLPEAQQATRRPRRPSPRPWLSLLDRARATFRDGRFESAYQQLLGLTLANRRFNPERNRDYARLMANVQARRGYPVEARQWFDRWREGQEMNLNLILEEIWFSRYAGLLPDLDRMLHGIERAEAWMADDDHGSDDAFIFAAHKGHALLKKGQPDLARDVLVEAIEGRGHPGNLPRYFSRALVDLADAHRRLKETREAQERLSRAQRVLVEHNCDSHYAELVLPQRAKLVGSSNPRQARAFLESAVSSLSEIEHKFGLARVLLLQARLVGSVEPNPQRRERLEQLQSRIPSLGRCPTMNRLLDNWDPWTRGNMIDGETDYYWNL